MLLLVCGQVIRPGYGWLLWPRQPLMLAQARTVLDADGFRELENVASRGGRLGEIGCPGQDHLDGGSGKGGLVSDIAVGDCVELTEALQETTSGAAPAGRCSTRC